MIQTTKSFVSSPDKAEIILEFWRWKLRKESGEQKFSGTIKFEEK